MRTLFLLLLSSCLSCFAQFSVEQPMFQLTSATPYSVTNDGAIAYYWNYQDLSDGTVTSWPDRKQALTWLRYETTVGPTKSSSGVLFTNRPGKTTTLTNTGTAYASNTVVGIIWKPTNPNSGYGTLLGMTNNIVGGATFWTLLDWSGDMGYLDWGAPAQWGLAFPVNMTVRQFTFVAWSNVYFHTWTNNAAGTLYAHSKANNWNAGDPDARFPGFYWLGHSPGASDNNGYQGTIQELIIWTNVTDIQKYLTNYWYYATNTYVYP